MLLNRNLRNLQVILWCLDLDIPNINMGVPVLEDKKEKDAAGPFAIPDSVAERKEEEQNIE
jgi:hypothetical protein